MPEACRRAARGRRAKAPRGFSWPLSGGASASSRPTVILVIARPPERRRLRRQRSLRRHERARTAPGSPAEADPGAPPLHPVLAWRSARSKASTSRRWGTSRPLASRYPAKAVISSEPKRRGGDRRKKSASSARSPEAPRSSSNSREVSLSVRAMAPARAAEGGERKIAIPGSDAISSGASARSSTISETSASSQNSRREAPAPRTWRSVGPPPPRRAPSGAAPRDRHGPRAVRVPPPRRPRDRRKESTSNTRRAGWAGPDDPIVRRSPSISPCTQATEWASSQ